MPEVPAKKVREHPVRREGLAEPRAPEAPRRFPAPRAPPCAELHVASNFSFLRGASHPDELVERAAALGYAAVGITDVNTLAGVVRAHVAAREVGIPLVVGCHVVLDQGPGPAERTPLSLLLFPTSLEAYGRLARLLTRGKRRAPKGECHLTLHDVIEHQEGMLAVAVPAEERDGLPSPVMDESFLDVLAGLRRVFDDDRLSLAAACPYGPDDAGRLRLLQAISAQTEVPLVATNDVRAHDPSRRALQDVLTCIRHGVTIDEAGFLLLPNGERHLKGPAEMARLFAPWSPGAIARTVEIARRAASFSLDQVKYEYPEEIVPPGRTPMAWLKELTWQGARERYGEVSPDLSARIEHEFALIEHLGYAKYFLTVHDIVRFARGRGILCQGRGAAANSAVCYCLGITSVDPARIDLLFERFVSKERHEPPDIDVDFEHERREEVIQYLYAKYGRHRAALCAEVITYRGRSAVREVGKALGLSLDLVDRLARQLDWWDNGVITPERARELGIDGNDPTIRLVLGLTAQILGFPRHLSQHVGGFVISDRPLEELVPIENAAMEDRTVIEWDKDDIDAMGFLKIDCLGLGMLTCIRKAFDMVEASGRRAVEVSPGESREGPLQLHTVPPEDPAVYDMLCAGDSVGVFQVESRAQMAMLPRLRPRCYYDLVIEVAIVRPGPIQGQMVHPYLRRRAGQEPVDYPTEEIRRVLGRTLGVPLFQEQAMRLAIVAAGFSAGEADQLRRAMAAWKRKGHRLLSFEDRFIAGMLANGYREEFARRCFEQLKGFSEYGFPESHAASFALLVYVSAWLKRHHPAAFAGALINSQPMGFYAPAQIVRDAQEHGVEVREPDVNRSAWDCTLEAPPPALRLGLRLVKGLREEHAHAIAGAVRAGGPFGTVEDLWRVSAVPVAALRRLARADAFRSMGLDRRQALWQIRELRDEEMPLFERNGAADAVPASLPALPLSRHVVQDYATVGLSLKAHPMSFLREALQARGVRPCGVLRDEATWPNGRRVEVSGVVLCRQRPGTASGIVFITLEDETGVANLIVRPEIYLRHRSVARHSVMMVARGRVERQGSVVHVLVSALADLAEVAGAPRDMPSGSRDFH